MVSDFVGVLAIGGFLIAYILVMCLIAFHVSESAEIRECTKAGGVWITDECFMEGTYAKG